MVVPTCQLKQAGKHTRSDHFIFRFSYFAARDFAGLYVPAVRAPRMSAAWQYLGSWLPTRRRTQDGLGAGEGERPCHARPANSNVLMWDIMEVVDEATCGSH